MINGMHALVYSREVDEARAFFKDVLGFPSIDIGGGWLIFPAPGWRKPEEAAKPGRKCVIFPPCTLSDWPHYFQRC